MSSVEEIKNIIHKNKEGFSKKYFVSEIGIFGSYSRGDQNTDSDIDIIVSFTRPIGLEFIDLAEELESLLGHKVDLVSKKGIKPLYYREIEKEIMYV
ncbi:MAG: nucleotidyltransferase family protein [bacterium]